LKKVQRFINLRIFFFFSCDNDVIPLNVLDHHITIIIDNIALFSLVYFPLNHRPNNNTNNNNYMQYNVLLFYFYQIVQIILIIVELILFLFQKIIIMKTFFDHKFMEFDIHKIQ